MIQRTQSITASFFFLLLTAIAEPAIIHRCDTLHIVISYGREVSLSGANDFFKVDSVSPGILSYPCSLSHRGIFFATTGGFASCTCCQNWSFGQPIPFYKSIVQIDWSRPLDIHNKDQFRKIDTTFSSSTGRCNLPEGVGSDNYIFCDIRPNDTNYLLVRAGTFYLNPLKPFEDGSIVFGNSVGQCKNMLVVDMYYQTDGSLDFSKANITLTKNSFNSDKFKAVHAIFYSDKIYDLQGHLISELNGNTPLKLPKGCYLKKAGGILQRFITVDP